MTTGPNAPTNAFRAALINGDPLVLAGTVAARLRSYDSDAEVGYAAGALWCRANDRLSIVPAAWTTAAPYSFLTIRAGSLAQIWHELDLPGDPPSVYGAD